MNFKIKQDNQGQRLDKFLTQSWPKISRSQIKKMIEQELILVNGKTTSVHNFLKIGDVITTKPADKKLKTKDKKPGQETKNEKLSPTVIFDSPDFLVLDKPAGLLVHATEKNETNTLADWIAKKYPSVKNVGEKHYRAGIIHRLDRDVSGIMVAAKNNLAFSHLKEQFQKRTVKKEYLALVYGRVAEIQGQIDLPIGRNKDGQFVAHPKRRQEKLQATDKLAKTQYEVLQYLKNYTLLKVRILTGRTHQIRAHLFAIGHPILGDQIYKPKNKLIHFLRQKIRVVNLSRIFLHSAKISFYDLKNQWQEFESPLPNELNNYLDELKK